MEHIFPFPWLETTAHASRAQDILPSVTATQAVPAQLQELPHSAPVPEAAAPDSILPVFVQEILAPVVYSAQAIRPPTTAFTTPDAVAPRVLELRLHAQPVQPASTFKVALEPAMAHARHAHVTIQVEIIPAAALELLLEVARHAPSAPRANIAVRLAVDQRIPLAVHVQGILQAVPATQVAAAQIQELSAPAPQVAQPNSTSVALVSEADAHNACFVQVNLVLLGNTSRAVMGPTLGLAQIAPGARPRASPPTRSCLTAMVCKVREYAFPPLALQFRVI